MGRFTIKMRNDSLRQSIEQAKLSDLKMNAIIIGSKCCGECDKIDKLEVPFEQLLKTPILPYIKCTRKPFCICCYGFKALRDENDRLMDSDY